MLENFFPKDDCYYDMRRVTIVEYHMDILYHVTFLDY